jgi:hypothetical protein
MSRGPTTFRQRDVAAAIKAARQAGIEVAEITVDRNGKITIISTKGAAEAHQTVGATNEWDEVLP